MDWIKTIGIFLRGLFKYMNNPQRWEWKNTQWEVRKPVKVQKAKNRIERLEDRGEKRNKRRDKRKRN